MKSPLIAFLLLIPALNVSGRTWTSADGKTLAFVAYGNGRDDIWTVDLTPGAEPKQITFSGSTRVFFANLVFSPDGKTIYFDKQEEVNTISMFENFNKKEKNDERR